MFGLFKKGARTGGPAHASEEQEEPLSLSDIKDFEFFANSFAIGEKRKLILKALEANNTEYEISSYETASTKSFAREAAYDLTAQILSDALIDTTEPFDDEILVGGVVVCVVSNCISLALDLPFEDLAEDCFQGIYAYALRDDSTKAEKMWVASAQYYNKIAKTFGSAIGKQVNSYLNAPTSENYELLLIHIKSLEDMTREIFEDL